MATKRTTRARRTASEGEIYEAVLAALLDGRLPAGTPLREQHLAAMFGATRGRARKVLMRLGHEGRLELIPNRGAFVPTPSLADARRVFEARRVLEAGIVATLAQGIVKRALEGTASNARAMDNRQLVAPLANAGWGAAQRAA